MIVKIDNHIINTHLITCISEIIETWPRSYCQKGIELIFRIYKGGLITEIRRNNREELEQIHSRLMNYWTEGKGIIEIK